MPLFAELKRRRVFRAVVAYAVVAWGVMQVADLVAPRLGLPDWTVTFIILAAALGLPIAIVLAWLYNFNDGTREADGAPFSIKPRVVLALALAVIVPLALFVVVRRRAVAAGVDANAVVVLPFRVAGSNDVTLMREGMVDLITTKLTGVGGPRAVDARTTLSAWRRTVARETEDLPPGRGDQTGALAGCGRRHSRRSHRHIRAGGDERDLLFDDDR